QTIHYSTRFQKELERLPYDIRELAINKEIIFKKNPYHPSLRLHQLHGKLIGAWSISITKNYRIIFEPMINGDILFVSIGTHDIYRSL
ncbi:MAG: plasmid stabilization protein, partial [Patescibacteria group bacterium]